MQSSRDINDLPMKTFSEATIVSLAIISVIIFIYSHLSWRNDVHESTPALDQVMELKVQLMSSHVLFEEMMKDHTNVSMDLVRDRIDHTLEMTVKSIEGKMHIGDAKGNLPDDPLLIAELMALKFMLEEILKHIESHHDGIYEHDELFEQAMVHAEAADSRIHDIFEEKLAHQQRFFSGALALWLITMVFLFWRWKLLSSRLEIKRVRLNKLYHAVEQTGESMLISDRHGTIEYVNPAFTEITGYSFDEAFGKNTSLLSSGKQNSEFYKKMWNRILSGKVWQGEVIDKRKDGSLYHAQLSISPIKDETNQVSHFVSVQRDITELRELEDNLFHARKMDTIGTLCSGLAHDLNNYLTVILGNVEIAKMLSENNNQITRSLEMAENAGAHAVAMTQELIDFSRRDDFKLEVTALDNFVQGIHTSMLAIGGDADFQVEVSGKKHRAMIDVQKCTRIVTNLIYNAIDAMEGKPNPKIHIKLEKLSSAKLQKSEGKFDKKIERWECISVTDNGSGMEPEIAEKIFEPFFTTKPLGKGTGLGLASVYGIMQNHRGFVEVETEVGKGTTFKLYFPSC